MQRKPILVLAFVIAWQTALAAAQDQDAPQETAASASSNDDFDNLADRYWSIVTDRPRRGTAFDLWYQHFLDAGRLSELNERVAAFTADEPNNSNAHVLIGLVHEREGREAEALQAYRQAESLAPQSYLPPLLQGPLLARQDELEAAAAALAKVLEREPPRAELHETYKELGRLQLRLGNRDQALATWSRLADAFPEDLRVQEELALLLSDEGQFDTAFEQWQRVERLSQDEPYARLKARLAMADLHQRRGKRDEALALLDHALDSVDPESWLAEDILRRIEALFERTNDSDGWIEWCRKRQRKRPRDLPALLTLARALSNDGLHEESLAQFRAAIELAPSRRDIREDLIRELERNNQPDAALAECAALVEQIPDDVELLVKLGQLHLQAASADGIVAAERRAAEAWKRIAAIREDDPALALQTAEICRRAARTVRFPKVSADDPPDNDSTETEIADSPPLLLVTAEEYYREALLRSGGAPQYIEYLGEFLHAAGRRDVAVETWSTLVPVDNPGAADWYRLAEVYSEFGYNEEALDAAQSAVALQPDDFALREFLVQTLLQAKKFNAALAQLPELEKLAATPQLEETALRVALGVHTETNHLDKAIEELASNRNPAVLSGRDHWLLGLLYARREQWHQAAHSLEAAMARFPDRIPVAVDYADVLRRAGLYQQALQQFERLAEIDERGRVEHYERIVELQLQLGLSERALDAVDELLRITPSNITAHMLKASIARQMKRLDVTLEALRQAVKLDPGSIEIRAELARTLADVDQPYEALEHQWRCLELSDDTTQMLSMTAALVDMAREQDRLDQLVDRLRRLRERQSDRKPITLCIARVLYEAGKFRSMTLELEEFLAERPHDLDALTALRDIAEEQQEWATAVTWQRRILEIDSDVQQLQTLARLLAGAGDYGAAGRVWQRILIETDDDRTLADAANARWQRGDPDGALALAEAAVASAPQSWRLRLLAGMFRLGIGDAENATPHFEAILDLPDSGRGAEGPPNPSDSQVAIVRSSAGNTRMTATLIGASAAQSGAAIHSPEYVELHVAARTYEHVRGLMSSRAFKDGRQTRSVQTTTLQLYPQLDTNLHQAQVAGATMLAAIFERYAKGGKWLDQRLAAAKSDPRQLRYVVQVYGARGRLGSIPDVVSMLELTQSQDPLPHLARLYRVSTQNYRTLKPDERSREVTSLKRSFEWLNTHRPDVTPLVAHNYITSLVSLGDSDAAVEHVMNTVESATSIAELRPLTELAFEIGTPESQREFLQKSVLLAEQSPEDGPAADAIAMIIATALRTEIARDRRPQDVQALVALTERFLSITVPRRLANTVNPSLSATFLQGSITGRRRIRRGGQSAWMLYYSASRNRAGQSRLRVEVKPFPPLNPLLDDQRYHTLRLVSNWLRERNDLLIERLQANIDGSQGLAADSFRMALACALWWSGDQVEAMHKLDALCDAHADNAGLLLVQAIGFINADRTVEALDKLTEIQETNSALAPDATNLRHAALMTLVQGDTQQLLRGLMTELHATGEPTLGPFFGRALPASSPRTSASPRRLVIAQGTKLPEVGSSQPPPFSRLLEELWRTEELSASADAPLNDLVAAARRQQERFPANAEVTALLATLQLAACRVDEARQTIVTWDYLAQRRPNLIKGPDAWVLIHACLRRDGARDVGATLARRALIARTGSLNASDTDTRIQRILTDWSTALAEVTSPQKRRAFAVQLANNFETTLGVHHREKAHAMATESLGILASALHADFVPDALEVLSERAPHDVDKLAESPDWARQIHLAVRQSRTAWPRDEQQRALEALISLIFPYGRDREPVLFEWARRGSEVQPGSLGMTAISLAKEVGELTTLRAAWDAHPLADSMPMLCLRAETAVALEQSDRADELLAQIKALQVQTDERPTLWSRYARSRLFVDHEAAKWVLMLGGGASVSVDPGGRIRNLADLSRQQFKVKDIRLIALTQVKDEDLERFRGLKGLETLSLSYTRVTDDGLEHLAGLSNLKILRLSGTGVTDDGLEQLRGLANLRSLMLQNSEVTKEGVQRLREALPDCTIDF